MRDSLDIARSYRRLSDVCDEWLTPIVSIAVAVGILRSVPSVFVFVSMLVGSFTSFLAGVCTGVAGVFLLLVAIWFLITKEYKKKDADLTTRPGTIPNPHPTRYDPEYSNEGPRGSMIPPAHMALKGRFSGPVWTVLVSEWDRHEALKDVDIQNKRVKMWDAELTGSTLMLTPEHVKKGLKPVVLDMTGCSINVVTECLGNKSPWWKKGPLEVLHHDRELLDGERAFFMFCEHGGAKEQWYIGLSRLDHQGDSVQLLQDMYSRYSALCHQKQYAVFPFLGSSPNSSGFSSPKERSSRNPRRGWMRRWWVNGRNGGGKSAGDVQELRVRGSLDLDEEGNPFAEMERMWMREGWASKGEENEVLRKHGAQRRAKGENQTVAQSPGPAKGTLELTVDVDGEGDGDPSDPGASGSPHEVLGTASPPSSEGSPIPDDMPIDSSVISQKICEENEEGIERLECATKSEELPTSPAENECSKPHSSMPVNNQGFDKHVNHPRLDETPDVPVGKDKPGISSVDSLDGIHGLNMFLARWAFDLARNPLFQEKFKEKLQKKINGLRRPNFVNPLTLVSMEVGTNFPVIHNVRSLPSPSKVIWPQILVDISYSGGLELILESTVDINETQAWSALDKAINLIGGQDQDLDNKLDGNDVPGSLTDDTDFLNEQATEECRNGRRLLGIMPLRKALAGKAKQLAVKMADSISKIPLRLSLQTSKLEGQLLVWVSPPPSDRLWMSFVGMPMLELHAKPILANRVMKYSAQLGRVSAWLEKKLQSSLFRSLVFPNCTDVRFPGLLSLLGDWGLRHPGKSLLSELASVAASDGEEDTCSETIERTEKDQEDCGLGVEGVDLPEAINKHMGSKSTQTSSASSGSSNKGQDSEPVQKHVALSHRIKSRNKSNLSESLSSIKEDPAELRRKSMPCWSTEPGLSENCLDYKEQSRQYASGSLSDTVDDSPRRAPTAAPPCYRPSIDTHKSVNNVDEDIVLNAKTFNREVYVNDGAPMGKKSGGLPSHYQSQLSGELGYGPQTRDNCRRKAMMQAARVQAGKQTSKMKDALGTKAAQIKRAAAESKFLMTPKRSSEDPRTLQ